MLGAGIGVDVEVPIYLIKIFHPFAYFTIYFAGNPLNNSLEVPRNYSIFSADCEVNVVTMVYLSYYILVLIGSRNSC